MVLQGVRFLKVTSKTVQFQSTAPILGSRADNHFPKMNFPARTRVMNPEAERARREGRAHAAGHCCLGACTAQERLRSVPHKVGRFMPVP